MILGVFIVILVFLITVNTYATNCGNDTNIFRRAGPDSRIMETFEKLRNTMETKIPSCTFLVFLRKIIPSKPKIITLTFFLLPFSYPCLLSYNIQKVTTINML